MIKVMQLKRVASNDDGTFGVLIDMFDTPFALTLEDVWKDNEQNISCIPDGTYLCERRFSPHFRVTFEVMNVPDRTHILFHKGNTEEDTKGCILIGEQFESLNDKTAILSSKKGFKEFMNRLKGYDHFNLNIVWV